MYGRNCHASHGFCEFLIKLYFVTRHQPQVANLRENVTSVGSAFHLLVLTQLSQAFIDPNFWLRVAKKYSVTRHRPAVATLEGVTLRPLVASIHSGTVV